MSAPKTLADLEALRQASHAAIRFAPSFNWAPPAQLDSAPKTEHQQLIDQIAAQRDRDLRVPARSRVDAVWAWAQQDVATKFARRLHLEPSQLASPGEEQALRRARDAESVFIATGSEQAFDEFCALVAGFLSAVTATFPPAAIHLENERRRLL